MSKQSTASALSVTSKNHIIKKSASHAGRRSFSVVQKLLCAKLGLFLEAFFDT